MPEISVIMPVYNAEKYLKEAVDSILQQSFTDFELFIIDDCSTDSSRAIIGSYADKRIVFIQKEKNTGYTDSLNMAIKLAKGKYIARMDADDISLKERFYRQYNHMEQNPRVLLLGTRFRIIGNNNEIQLPTTFKEIKFRMLFADPICHPSVFIRKSFFTSANSWYDKSFEPAEDYELWTRIIHAGEVENLPEVLLHYREHEQQVSNVKKEIQNKAADKIKIKQLEQLISFSDKNYTKEFALNFFIGKTERASCKELLNLKSMINDIYAANNKLKVYNVSILEKHLRAIWLRYLFSAYDYKISCLPLLFPWQSSKITGVPFYLGIKFLIKSIVGWRRK